VLGTIGTGVIIAGIIFYLLAVLVGYVLALGGDKSTKSVMALGTGQRNLSAAFVVAAGNFAHKPDVIIALMVMVIVDLVLLLPLAGEIGKRVGGGKEGSVAEAET
jgi:BASS family bile acid:Na+ symporter